MSLTCGIRLAHGWKTPTTVSVNPKFTPKRHTVMKNLHHSKPKFNKTFENSRNSRKKLSCFGRLAENRSKKGVHSKVFENLSVFLKEFELIIDTKSRPKMAK